MAADGSCTWIRTGSPEHCAATAAHGFSVVLRRMRVRRFAAAIGITRLHAAGVPA